MADYVIPCDDDPQWAENMATAQRVAGFREWVHGVHAVKPTRGEIREMGGRVLAELARVDALVLERSTEVEELERDREAAKRLHGRMESQIEALRRSVDDAREGLRAEAEAHDADVAQLGDERDELRRFLSALTVERDGLLAQRDEARRERDEYLHTAAELTEESAALRLRLRAAHCERDRARHFECEHGVRVAVRLHRPGGVASNDVDV